MTDFAPLDHPIWNALTSVHAAVARVNGAAIRYPSSVSPLSALREYRPAAFDDMRALADPGAPIAFFTPEPIDVPSDWQVLRALPINQMACVKAARPAPMMPLLTLGDADVPEMLALTAATEPGPFNSETIRMGRYYGIRAEDGRLAAMAGQRLQTKTFTEISAVCTDPAQRGKGYAAALVAFLTHDTLAAGKIPFLNVFPENPARFVYEKAGFTLRKSMQVTVVTPI